MKSGTKKILKRFLIFVCSLVVIFGFIELYMLFEDNFSQKNISYDAPVIQGWSPPVLKPQEEANLNSILHQKFTYIGKGHQSYAFVSEDNQYVLKFFKFTYLKPSWFINWLPPLPFIVQYRERLEKGKQKRLHRVFRGYRIAYENDKDNSGLIYIHLLKTHNLHTTVNVKDKFGIEHTVDLDPIVFVVQKKARMTREVLKDLLDHNDLETFKSRIRQIFNLYVAEYKQGIFDSDHNVMSNTGFVGDRAIRLDVGRLTYNEDIKNPAVYMKDLKKIAVKRIDKWLKVNYPMQYDELIQDVEAKLSEITGEKVALH